MLLVYFRNLFCIMIYSSNYVAKLCDRVSWETHSSTTVDRIAVLESCFGELKYPLVGLWQKGNKTSSTLSNRQKWWDDT